MELLVASAIGIMTAGGLYLVLRLRTFPVILGMSLLTYAVNVFLFASGRLTIGAPPILTDDAARYTDPLPQALVLTAIVISFGMTAVVVMIALGAYLGSDDDHVDDHPAEAAVRQAEDEEEREEAANASEAEAAETADPEGRPA